MKEYPKFKPKEYPTLFTEQTDKDLAQTLNPNFRYTHFSTIAKGGKSLIQSCRDTHLNRVVCYKSLLPAFADDPIEQKRLLREARVSAMLQHPNTLPTYEVGRTRKGGYYFTMKLVHGYTFREILEYRERYDLSQLIDIIIQVAKALEFSHAHGVIHRDIKPANILVGPFGEVLLLDWGLAKVWSKVGEESPIEQEVPGIAAVGDKSMTGIQKLQGTVCYMSPEQIRRDKGIGAQTDVYSLGVVLYEALTGRTPAQGERVDQVINSTLNEEPPLPSSLVNNIPFLLEETVMQCLVKDTNHRVKSAAELIRLLQQSWSLSDFAT